MGRHLHPASLATRPRKKPTPKGSTYDQDLDRVRNHRWTYGRFLKRLMMKKIVRDKPGNLSLDTSRDHEYTEWDEVKRFAEDFPERLVLQRRFEDR
jgi:hypothetical protein